MSADEACGLARRIRRRLFPFLAVALALLSGCRRQPILVGSKKFTESYVLGEIVKRKLESAGVQVEHRQGMGATGIVWTALRTGKITMYPEYTGTISEEIFKVKGGMDPAAMRAALAKEGVGMSESLGFEDKYGLVMLRSRADELGIHNISDLRGHTDLVVRPSAEFLKRRDGWEPLTARYALQMKDVAGMEHEVGYPALRDGKIDLMDAYTTDAKIAEYNLEVLNDDLHYFPDYKAVILYRLSAPKAAVAAIGTLAGTIDDARMTRLNFEAEKTKNYAEAASLYYGGQKQSGDSLLTRTLRYTGQHLWLVGVSLFFAILAGVPLGILASRPGIFSAVILGITGGIQTIPSIALLTMLIAVPFLGIGSRTAIVALFLYSLLPIVRNTASGLQDIPLPVRESAAALGLETGQQMTRVFLPMASRAILAGIKTSAVINVGTATLAAFIGAGGLGEPIVSGLALNDNATVLQGAVPAAILALLVQGAFELLDRAIIPRGLRLSPEGRPA